MTSNTPRLKVLRGEEPTFRELTSTKNLQDRDITYREADPDWPAENVKLFRELPHGLTAFISRGDKQVTITAGLRKDLVYEDAVILFKPHHGIARTIYRGTKDEPNQEYVALNAELTEAESRVEKVLGRPLRR